MASLNMHCMVLRVTAGGPRVPENVQTAHSFPQLGGPPLAQPLPPPKGIQKLALFFLSPSGSGPTWRLLLQHSPVVCVRSCFQRLKMVQGVILITGDLVGAWGALLVDTSACVHVEEWTLAVMP